MGKGISEVDPVLDALGATGRYQFLQFFFAVISSFSTSFQLLNYVFVGRVIPHTCSLPHNTSEMFDLINNETFHMNTSNIEFQKCNIKVESNISGVVEATTLDCVYGHSYAERKDLSVISDMDVVCNRAALKGLGQTLLILGQGLGAFTFPIFSDRFGRRPVQLACHFLMLTIGIGVAFSPAYLAFLVLRIFVGASQQGVVMSRSTFTVELFPARHRKISALGSNIVFCFTSSTTALVAYLTRNLSWRHSQLVFCAPIITVFVQFLSGRKKTSMTLHGIAAAGLLVATIMKYVGHDSHWSEVAVTVFSCVGMFGILGALVCSFFFTPEMFPTNLRNLGLGTASSFSRLGGMLAPFASLLAEYVSWAPGVIFAGCCIVVTLVVNLLPETMGREIPQTLHDLESWYKKGPSKCEDAAAELEDNETRPPRNCFYCYKKGPSKKEDAVTKLGDN